MGQILQDSFAKNGKNTFQNPMRLYNLLKEESKRLRIESLPQDCPEGVSHEGRGGAGRRTSFPVHLIAKP